MRGRDRTMTTTETIADAVLSPDGAYRYQLTRRWADDPRWVRFVMLNPSTADATVDDPTIRRCLGFARALGFTGLVVHNLFALRATDPRELRGHPGPTGPYNARYLIGDMPDMPPCALTICAWGAHPLAARVAPSATRLLADRSELACLGLTAKGAPAHPLYLPAAARPRPYPPDARTSC